MQAKNKIKEYLHYIPQALSSFASSSESLKSLVANENTYQHSEPTLKRVHAPEAREVHSSVAHFQSDKEVIPRQNSKVSFTPLNIRA